MVLIFLIRKRISKDVEMERNKQNNSQGQLFYATMNYILFYK